MRDLIVYLVVAPIALVIGVLIGFLLCRYITKKQMEEWKRQMETPDKEQIRNMLIAVGQKPSEEKVNRFINLTKVQQKKKKLAKKTSKKKK
jgi:uncharacterized protein YneF (UPF0154 family)